MNQKFTEMTKVATNNLKSIDVSIPHRSLTVISGVSGSGKSSLAFDTLYAEGQRRFVESLSTYARQFLKRMERPAVEAVVNIQPSLALRQKNSIKHARSTVGTLTEIVDHLALLFAHIGVTTCPTCELVVRRDRPEDVAADIEERGDGRKILFVADVPVLSIDTPQRVLDELVAGGYRRICQEDGTVHDFADLDVEKLLKRSSFPILIDRQKTRKTSTSALRLREAIEHAYRLGKGTMRVIDVTEPNTPTTYVYNAAFRCNGCARSFIEPIPTLFSFNSPIGACPTCSGFGRTAGVDMNKVVANPNLSLKKGAVAVFQTPAKRAQKRRMITAAAAKGIAIDVPFRILPDEDKHFILEGGKGYSGVRGFFKRLGEKKHKTQNRITLARYRGYTTCEDCGGGRCSQDARNVTIHGLAIHHIWSRNVRDALALLDNITLTKREESIARDILHELRHRLHYLLDVGLGYLALDRSSRTLSGGEVQRIHLTSSLGRTLTDTLYVLDEPTAGLHPRDSLRLLSVLRRLRDLGNTVVVVEHDPEMIEGADWLVELGPSGGEAGGQLLFQGPIQEALAPGVQTPTAQAMAGRIHVDTSLKGDDFWVFDPKKHPHLSILGACANNLQGVDAHIPLHAMTCITGVSGSGKSTLVHQCMVQNWRKSRGEGVDAGTIEALRGFDQVNDVVLMRQGGLGRSSRSNVASYTGAWDGIRKLFSKLPEAGKRGLGPGDFSFNRPGGRCEKCEGTGTLLIEMHFMADIEVICDSCDGKRFTQKVLHVDYGSKNIYDVLQLTVDEAWTFFEHHKTISRRLEPLREVGLGYLRLGQTTSTLSGGEAQRLMLASYLGHGKRKGESNVLFVFDEPTVGLHLCDIEVLVRALRRVVDEGHTVLVVEHNSDFIRTCDHIIDLGPGGGDEGGRIIAQGPPFEVAACKGSWTGQFLAAPHSKEA